MNECDPHIGRSGDDGAPTKVTLTVTKGEAKNVAYVFREHDTFIIGRGRECHARVGSDDVSASRVHCLVEIDPPFARVRDLASRNGTFVNGVRSTEVDLKDGDVVTVGGTDFTVTIDAAALQGRCAVCACETVADGADVCPKCAARLRADPAALVPEGSVAERYELGAKLGEGGMGAVYLARRKRDGKPAAMKVMLASTAVHERSRRMFLREIEIMSRLRHPNIVEMYEHGSAGQSFFVVMELCERGSLDQLVRARGGRLPTGEAVRIILQVLDGLAAAHACGIVHRDVKPQNILLTGHAAKVADLGLAKSFEKAGLSGMTVTGAFGGTPVYMSRDQLVRFKYSAPAADVWSVGATLYATLTGALPRNFAEGRSAVDVILREEVIPIRDREATIPQALADVIDRSLSDDVTARYQNAAELRAALASAV